MEYKVERKAKIQNGQVVLNFFVDVEGERFALDPYPVAGRLELPATAVRRLTGGLISREVEVLTNEDLSPYGGWVGYTREQVCFPARKGREAVKAVTRLVIDRIRKAIDDVKAEAERLALKGWLWEKAETDENFRLRKKE